MTRIVVRFPGFFCTSPQYFSRKAAAWTPVKLNHCANRIRKGTLDLMLELFVEELGFSLLRHTGADAWLRHGAANVDIQFCETEAPPTGFDKHNSHISFLSRNPRADLERLSAWLNQRGIRTAIASWSDREFHLDAPEVFVDFAVEGMTPDLADYGGVV